MSWVLVAVVAWLACSAAVALLLGRSIRLADRRERTDRAMVLRPDRSSRPAVVRGCVRPAERRPAARRVGRR